ncbi:hypothetical protein GCM10018773_41540 [Streptomyces candidus]|nr:hypothetical protein GCM10018773_41540 [Streptomyces candidus]
MFDRVEAAVEVEVKACVVERAVLDLPVVAGVVEHAVVEGRKGFGAGCGERVQRAVTPAPLQEAEQGAARRYDWFKHGEKPHIKLSTHPGFMPCLRRATTCSAARHSLLLAVDHLPLPLIGGPEWARSTYP